MYLSIHFLRNNEETKIFRHFFSLILIFLITYMRHDKEYSQECNPP